MSYLQQVFLQNPALLLVLGFIVGLIVGSFLNVVIYRFPAILEYQWSKDCCEHLNQSFGQKKPKGLVFERSYCPRCKQLIPGWYNVPLLGYILLRGRCANCKGVISIRYPLIELLSGLLTVAVLYYYGFTLKGIALVILTWWLIVIAFIDLDTYLLPDQLSLTLLWLGMILSVFGVGVGPVNAILGACVGYLSLWLLYQLFRLLTGKEGMGYGDFKLLSAAGAWLGAAALLPVVIVASVSGLLMAAIQYFSGYSSSKIPFGPFLSIGIWIMAIFEKQLTNFFFPYL